MSSFLSAGEAALPDVKVDARAVTGATDEWTAEDANDLRQALLDLRSYIINTWPAGDAPTVYGQEALSDTIISLIQALSDIGIIANRTPYQKVQFTAKASDAYYVAVG